MVNAYIETATKLTQNKDTSMWDVYDGETTNATEISNEETNKDEDT